MKQVIQNFKTGELKVDDVPAPILKPGGVLVQNYFSVISAGTEKSTVSVGQASLLGKAKQKPEQVKQVLETVKKEGLASTYQKVQNKLGEPKALGYSSSGRVIAVADDVREFQVGDLVACGGQDYASHAEIVFVPKNLVVKVPEAVSMEDAAFSTLGAIAMQGVRLCKPELGHKVAVIGMGLLGHLACQMLLSSGCEVLALDVSEKAFESLDQSPAVTTAVIGKDDIKGIVESLSSGYGLDAVLITAGTSSNEPIELAGEITRKKGRVVVTGAVRMDIPRDNYFKKEISVVISSSYGAGRYDVNYEERGIDYPYAYVRFTEKRNFETFLTLLATKKLNLTKLKSHRFPIADAMQAYDIVLGKVQEVFKSVVLTYDQADTLKIERSVDLRGAKNSSVGISFIGAGSYAQSFLLPAAKSVRGAEMRSVCTSNGINAKSVAEKNGFSTCTTAPESIFTDEKTNIVFIATRHNTHASYVLEALKSGKHVFVEKPLAMNEDELSQIKTLAESKANQQLAVGFNRRYSILTKEIKKIFNKVNEPILVNYRVNAGFIPKDHWIQDPVQGGGRIIGEVCHFIDYANYIIDSKVTSIYAQSIVSENKLVTNEDTVVITMTYANGSLATITYLANGDKSVPKERIEVTGSNNYAILDDFNSVSITKNGKTSTKKAKDKGQKTCASMFVEHVLEGKELFVLDKLVEVTQLSFDVLKSIKSKASVQY
jgi:polar amino acid transport system substrate-binding protein